VTYTDTTVAAGNAYSYRVVAVNGPLPSAYSNVASVTIPSLPAIPAGLTATSAKVGSKNNRITLNWTDVATETSYQLQRATNSTFTAGLSATTLGANVTTTQQTVPRGTAGVTTYWYRIQSLNAAGPSDGLPA